MTLPPDSPAIALPRPPSASGSGPLDERFYDLVEGRFRRVLEHEPVAATYFGIHDYDDQLGDGGRETILAEIAADRAHLAAVEALDPAALSGPVRFERDLELHNVRRSIFEADVLRIWERRSLALDTVGDGLFLLFVRDHAPLAERLDAIAGRLEAIPRLPRRGADAVGRAAGPAVAAHRDRVGGAVARAPRRARRRRPRRGRPRGAAPSRTGGRCRRRGRGAVHHAGSRGRSPAAPTSGRSAASATTSWSRCARSTVSTRTGSSSSAIGALADERAAAERGRPRDRPRRRRGRGHRRRSRPTTPADVRCRAGGVPRRDAPRPRPPHRARHRHDPRRRAHRGHRDAPVPAQRHPVRGVLLARRVRRTPRRGSTS